MNKLKKVFALMLAVLMIGSLCACVKKKDLVGKRGTHDVDGFSYVVDFTSKKEVRCFYGLKNAGATVFSGKYFVIGNLLIMNLSYEEWGGEIVEKPLKNKLVAYKITELTEKKMVIKQLFGLEILTSGTYKF